MKFIFLLFNLLFLQFLSQCYAQTNIKQELQNADPVKYTDSTTFDEQINTHQRFLKDAIAANDKKKQFYSYIYLWSDFFYDNNYPEATRAQLNAKKIASEMGNISWQGASYLRAGIVSFEMERYDEAIQNFKLTLAICRETKDTLCIGESLQEISITYRGMKKYDSAHYFFKKALPFLQRASSRAQMGIYFNSFGNLLSEQGNYAEAKIYLDSSIAIAMDGTDVYVQMTFKNNLADFYGNIGEFDKAINLLKESIPINKQNKWADILVYNYGVLYKIYEKKKDYPNAYRYLQSYNRINDSLYGAETQLKIAAIKTKAENEKRNAALKQKQMELSNAKQTMEIILLLVILGITIISFFIARLIGRTKKTKAALLQNKENLNALTQLLIKKNSLLAEQDEAFLKLKKDNAASAKHTQNTITEPEDFEKNLYNQRILTKEDWLSFKIYFEKAYPGYLFRLRNNYATLTEAEERSFLFIKLNLKNKEVAAILGISVDSVNKTRSRLRKRLNLPDAIDLDEYVKNF